MKSSNKFLPAQWLLRVIPVLALASSCQKPIHEPIAEMNRSEEISQMAKSGKAVYWFKRINEDNFSSEGWREQQVNIVKKTLIYSDLSDYVAIVCGPNNNNDPRLLQGAVSMNLPTDDDRTLFRTRLWKSGYSGTRLADLTELKFSTYVVQTAPATLILQIDVNGDGTHDFNIFYNQLYLQDANFPPLVLNSWQEWDALHQGVWRISQSIIPIPANLANGGTIQQIVAVYPNASIIDFPPTDEEGEGIRFNIGGPLIPFDNTVSYLDALIIGTKNQPHSTLFDFTCNQ
jgi:hypothetical protein